MDEDCIIETLSNELDVTQQRLKSKVKSIKIIFREYKVACHENEYYKSLVGKLVCDDNKLDLPNHTYELTKENIKLKSDNNDLLKKLSDLTKDLNAYKKVFSEDDQINDDASSPLVKHIPSYTPSQTDIEDVSSIENLKEKVFNLQLDNKALQDDMEDLIAERDEYKTKFKRLNAYLNTILCPDQTEFSLDIDKIITENKILMDEYDVLRTERDILATKLNKQKHFGTNFSSHISKMQHKLDHKNVIGKDKIMKAPKPTQFKQRYDITSLYNNERDRINETKPTSRGVMRANNSVNSNPFSDDDLSESDANSNHSNLFHVLKYVNDSPSEENIPAHTEVKITECNTLPTNSKRDRIKYRSTSEEAKEGIYEESMIGKTQSNSCEPILSN